MVFCFCPSTPPEKVKATGGHGARDTMLLNMKEKPHQFGIGLKDSCCADPCCCLLSSCGAPCGFTACWARKAVLNRYHNGIEDYQCCQGYCPKCCCCFDPETTCRGSACGLYLEGCCCPMFSLSIARIHLMQTKQIRPDPCDYQLIQCSNCLQCARFILDIIGIFFKPAREAAHCFTLIADCFTFSVAGCMGAQISTEMKKDGPKGSEVVYVVVTGVPVTASGAPLAAQDGAAVPTGVPVAEAMARP